MEGSSDEEVGNTGPSFSEIVLPAAMGEDAPKRPNRVGTKAWLYPGEDIVVREPSMGYVSLAGKRYGSVTVTNYRLRFKAKDPASDAPQKNGQFVVALGMIHQVLKMGHSTVSRGEDAYGIEIICKDLRHIKFVSQKEGHTRRALFESLQKYAFPLSNKLEFFAFGYQERFRHNGWKLYDPVKEYRRMGVPEDVWMASRINERFEFCETYPSVLWLPRAAGEQGEDFLERAASHRSRQRLPVLSWISREGHVSLTRSSQPLTGVTGRRNTEDEKHIQLIIEANAQSAKLYIADARPEVNAKVNKAKGGGYESEEAYPDAELQFLDIQNIHVMRESLRKVKDICYPRVDEKTWLTSLDDTNWLDHIKLVLLAAAKVADKMYNQRTSVLVHCSDGWDRTAQITSLAMVLLDPFYRTFRGFMILVEKEWCSFGHKFSHRLGLGEDKPGNDERSPVFLQFIDCVWQLTNMFPTAFEFNEFFLMRILDEMYSCRFGTFLYNCEKQRAKEGVREKTQSLWSWMMELESENLNPIYDAKSSNVVILTPASTLRRIQLWNSYYLRHNPEVCPLERALDKMELYRHLLGVKAALEDEVRRLRVERDREGVEETTPRPSPSPRPTPPPRPLPPPKPTPGDQ